MAAIAAAPAIASAIAPAGQDPIFAAIEAHDKARMAFVETLKTLRADEGVPYPEVQVVGNPWSGLPPLMVSSHKDIDTHTPADMYPQGEQGAARRTVSGYCAL